MLPLETLNIYFTDRKMDRETDTQIDRRTDGKKNRWTEGQTHEPSDGWNGWTYGRTNRRTNGKHIDGWALHTFETVVTEVWDVHTPIKRRQKRHKPTPWMMPDLLGLIQVLDKLHKKFMRNKTSNNWLSYKQARNYATTAMRTAKRTFFKSAVNNSKKILV